MVSGGILQIVIYSLITAVFTGLGALPFLWKKNMSKVRIAKANAVAGALMLAASFGLIYEGVNLEKSNITIDISYFSEIFMGISGAAWGVVGGILFGLIFIIVCDKILSKYENLSFHKLQGADAKKVLLIIGIMTLHSFTEGVAIGVSFGPSEGFGIFIALAIALHNIPEGLAISTVLVPKGYKWSEAAGWAIFSSLPQVAMAIPAFLFVQWFGPILPVGLGFAAGAMIRMSMSELFPEALQDAPSSTIATIVTIGITCMVLFQQFVG